MDVISECMKMTSFGGQAKSLALQAIKHAREGDMPAAAQAMEDSEMYLNKSHEAHTSLLGQDANAEQNGDSMQVSFFMVHAADHLSSANTVFVLAKELIYLYERRMEHHV